MDKLISASVTLSFSTHFLFDAASFNSFAFHSQVPRKGNSGEFSYLMPLVRDAVHLLVQALNKSVSYLATNDTSLGICPGNGLHTQCGGSQLRCVLRTMLLQSNFEGESVRLENRHWECCTHICMFVCVCECMRLLTGMCVISTCMYVCMCRVCTRLN